MAAKARIKPGTEIDKCPYCGSDDVVVLRVDYTARYQVACNSCHARGPEANTPHESMMKIINEWNYVSRRARGLTPVTPA